MLELFDWQFSIGVLHAVLFPSILGLSIFFSFLSWKKKQRRKSLLFLESIKTFAVILILFTVLNPGKIVNSPEDEKPNILCLLDESKSMETKDIIDQNGSVLSRYEWSNKLLQLKWVKDLEENATFTIRNFSSRVGKHSTDISFALDRVLEEYSKIKAILLLSDGESNSGSSILASAGKLRGLNTPVYSIVTGSRVALPDLSIEKGVGPSFVLKEEKINIPYRIKNNFTESREVKINLFANQNLVQSKSLVVAPSSDKSGNIAWLPPKLGEYNLKVSIPLQEGEVFSYNNEKESKTRVKHKTIKALLIDSLPRWEYRFLRNALERDPGVDLKCLLFHPDLENGSGKNYLSNFPVSFNQLAIFDVVFLGDVGIESGELSEEDCDRLKDLIQQQASGLVFLPGKRGRQISLENSPLKELIPVIFDPDNPSGLGTFNLANLELTNRGKNHWLTNLRGAGEPDLKFWNKLPGFNWSAMVLKSKPGSEVLAVHSNFKNDWGRMPIITIRYSGAGKSLFMGIDSAWKWRRGVEDKYHYRFWSQVVRWMAHGRYFAEEEGIRLITDPESPKAGENVYLRCICLDKDGFPIENGKVSALVLHPDGIKENITFIPERNGPGVYLAKFIPQESGSYQIILESSPYQRKLEVGLRISENTKEKVGMPIAANQMHSLSSITGGNSSSFTNWRGIINEILVQPSPEPILKVYRLRTSTPWGIFIFCLLTIYWIGRKKLGMI